MERETVMVMVAAKEKAKAKAKPQKRHYKLTVRSSKKVVASTSAAS